MSAQIKIHQILASFETANQSFFKFSINLQCHETQLLCTFLAEILYAFNKRSLSRYKFSEIQSLKFGSLMGSLRQNNIKFQLKKKSYLSWTKFKYDMRNFFEFWGIFHPTTQKFQNFTSMHYFCPKYMRFELKNTEELYFHDIEQWCKVWINPDLVDSKMAWGIGCTFITALKNKKNGILMGPFCPKSENLHFDWILLSTSNKRVMFHDTEECQKLKTDSWLQKWPEEFGEFYVLLFSIT